MTQTIQWGATTSEWRHFSKTLGLTQHMLPVVSNPRAIVSARSTVKGLGKTPSRFNQDHEVVGIGNWTNLHSTESKVEYWSTVEDYGICLQTRDVRAFDIDIADPATATAVAEFINDHLFEELPTRMRSNSSKCLMAIRIAGELGKRTIPVGEGMVEFLASGQQFIAAGTHTSGVRYEWVGGLPTNIPEITLDVFEALWLALVAQFGTGPATGTTSTGEGRQRAEHLDIPDPVADHLVASGLSLGTTRSGDHLVQCPWNDTHTSGTVGDSSTLWFKAGTNGYAFGHFDCRHAHCMERTDAEFFAAVGYAEPDDVFEPVVLDAGDIGGSTPGTGPAAGVVEEPPTLTRKKGRVEATILNIVAALEKPIFSNMRVRHDQFRDAIMFCRPGSDQYTQFTDMHYTELRCHYEGIRRFQPISKDMTRDAVLSVAKKDAFDSAITWLDRLVWDESPRVEQFLTTYFGVPDTAYARAVSRYIWTALAGRTLLPGVKADMVPILVGGQGARKSSAVAAMVVADDFFTELQLDSKEDDMSRKMRGCQIAELAELQGLHTKALEAIKAFVSRRHESWVPKYQEFSTKFSRRLIFIGTTNQQEFLADETGNRRWLPVVIDGFIDVEAIERDREQLWAEAGDMFVLGGVEYRDAERLAAEVHSEHMMSDSWQDAVEAWLDAKDPMTDEIPRTRNYLQIANVLKEALDFDSKAVHHGHEIRMGKILQKLGYKRLRKRIMGLQKWVYVYPSK